MLEGQGGHKGTVSKDSDGFAYTYGQRESSFRSAMFAKKWESGLGDVAGNCYFTYIRAQPPAAAPVDAGCMLSSVQIATDRMPSRVTLS